MRTGDNDRDIRVSRAKVNTDSAVKKIRIGHFGRERKVWNEEGVVEPRAKSANRERMKIWCVLSQHIGTRPARGSLVSIMSLCSVRTRLATTLRCPRRSFTSVSEASQKRLFSQDDWTALQLERAERTTLS